MSPRTTAPPSLVPPSVAGLPLEAARAAFDWLSRGPGPIGVDGRRVAGLPARPVPVEELRDLLADRRCRVSTRDGVWAHLVRRARAEGGTWTVVCVGLALPTLEETCGRLCGDLPPRRRLEPDDCRGGARRTTGEVRAEVESAVLSGFLTELAATDLRRPGIALRLTTAGYEAGRLTRREIEAAPRPRAALLASCPPPGPARHPDLVLARAVAAKALSHSEAVLIGATRLEPLLLTDIARARGQTPRQVRAARIRAERKLAAYLREPSHAVGTALDAVDVRGDARLSARQDAVTNPPDPDSPATVTAAAARPTKGRRPRTRTRSGLPRSHRRTVTDPGPTAGTSAETGLPRDASIPTTDSPATDTGRPPRASARCTPNGDQR